MKRQFQLQRLYGQGVLFFFAALLLVAMFGVSTVHVSGQSMLPTLQDRQWLLIRKYPIWLERFGFAALQRGDVVTLRAPRENVTSGRFIKRIVAVPGDRVAVKENVLFLDGEAVREPFTEKGSSLYPDSFPEVLLKEGELIALEGYALTELPDYLQLTLRMLEPVPEAILERSHTENLSYVATLKLEPGYYFVLGDNRAFNASEDSRVFGPIAARAMTGRYLPLGVNKDQHETLSLQEQIR